MRLFVCAAGRAHAYENRFRFRSRSDLKMAHGMESAVAIVVAAAIR